MKKLQSPRQKKKSTSLPSNISKDPLPPTVKRIIPINLHKCRSEVTEGSSMFQISQSLAINEIREISFEMFSTDDEGNMWK